MLVVLSINLILHPDFLESTIYRLITGYIDYLIRALMDDGGLDIVLMLTFLCLINIKHSYFAAALLSLGGFLFVIFCLSNLNYCLHYVSVNVLPLSVIRVSFEYCPCRTFFVGLRMLGYAQAATRSGAGYVSLFIYYIMALINSLAIGKSRKSAGNLTYKTVRGRTIASQRITSNSSRTALQVFQRGAFSDTVKCMQLVIPWINNFFDKSKYGSSRNQFMKICKSYNMGGDRASIIAGDLPLADGFLKGIAVSRTGVPIVNTSPYTSYGSAPVIVTGRRAVNEYIHGNAQADFFEYPDGVSFAFPTPILREKVELLIGGFNIKGADDFSGVPFSVNKFNATTEDVSKIAQLGLTATVTASDDDYVSNILIAPNQSAPAAVQNSLYCATVRVNGKIATTDAMLVIPRSAG